MTLRYPECVAAFPDPIVGELTAVDLAVMNRINPLLGEVHDTQQTAFAGIVDADGKRGGVEVRPFYMNGSDRVIAADERPGVWEIVEYNETGEKVGSARVQRTPTPQGTRYDFTMGRNGNVGSHPADPDELAHEVGLLAQLADARDAALAAAQARPARAEVAQPQRRWWAARALTALVGRHA